MKNDELLSLDPTAADFSRRGFYEAGRPVVRAPLIKRAFDRVRSLL